MGKKKRFEMKWVRWEKKLISEEMRKKVTSILLGWQFSSMRDVAMADQHVVDWLCDGGCGWAKGETKESGRAHGFSLLAVARGRDESLYGRERLDWEGIAVSSPFGSSGLAVQREEGRWRNLLGVARWRPPSLWGGEMCLPRRSSWLAVERGRGEGKGGICWD